MYLSIRGVKIPILGIISHKKQIFTNIKKEEGKQKRLIKGIHQFMSEKC